jgi:hypothetical protein
MRALTVEELGFVSGGTEGGSQLMGPDQMGVQFGGVGVDGSGFGSSSNGLTFGGEGLFRWPWEKCDAACQKAEREARERREREKEAYRLRMEQLRNNRMAACADAGSNWTAGSWVAGASAVFRGISADGGYYGESCSR